MNNIKSTSIFYALILGVVALLCVEISVGVYLLTKGEIDEVTAKQQQRLLEEVVPESYFDNDILATCKVINSDNAPYLNRLYFAKKSGKMTAYIVQSTAPDGYSGNIVLLMGIEPNGNVLGVRVIEHKETPGLGDKIETRVSDWITSFSNRLFNLENENEWAVKKDGGNFDQFTGATVTPRAVVNNVRQSAKWVIGEFIQNPKMTEQFEYCK